MKTEILVAVISGFAVSLTTIVTVIVNARNSRRIEALKTALEQKKEKDNEVMKWLLSYQTDIIHQHLLSLKEFLTVVQYSKDRLRSILEIYDHMIIEERQAQLEAIRQSVIDKYAATRFYFDSTPYGGQAHLIKSKLLLIITKLLTGGKPDMSLKRLLIDEISMSQHELHKGMEREILQRYHTIQNKV